METDFQIVAIFEIFPQKPCVFMEFSVNKTRHSFWRKA